MFFYIFSEKYTRFCQWKNLELNIQVGYIDVLHIVLGFFRVRGGHCTMLQYIAQETMQRWTLCLIYMLLTIDEDNDRKQHTTVSFQDVLVFHVSLLCRSTK